MKKIFLLICTFCFSQYVRAEPLNWSPPVAISTSGVTATASQIAADVNGNAVALWLEKGIVKFSYQPVGSTWVPAQSLSTAGMATMPQIGIDTSGRVTALWLENTVVSTASRSIAGSWGPITTLSGVGADAPQLAVDGSGNCVAIWDRQGNIESATKLSGGSWPVTPDTLSSLGNSAAQVAIGANGTVAAAWHTLLAGTYSVNAATKTINGSWSTANTISTGNGSNQYPDIAVDSNGNTLALWYNGDSTFNLQYATLPNQGSWSAPTMLSDITVAPPSPSSLKIAFDATGEALALWRTIFSGFSYGYRTAVRDASGNWQSPIDLVTNNWYAYAADIAVQPDGRSYLTYMTYDYRIASTLIYVIGSRINTPYNAWAPLVMLSQGTVNGYPHVAASRQGNVLTAAVLWSNNNGPTEEIHATTGTGTVVLPPTSPMVVQNVNDFGLYTEYYNTVSWQPGPTSNPLFYVVYRNGTLFNSTLPPNLQIVEHNAVQNGSVTYGIGVVDQKSFQSDLVTVTYP